MGIPCNGEKSKRHNESLITGSALKKVDRNLSIVAKSICKIFLEGKNGSGFFIKFDMGKDEFQCLMSNEHVIDINSIEQRKTITVKYDFSEKTLKITLNPRLRYIKSFQQEDELEQASKNQLNIDATIVQILPEDNVSNDYFLELESGFSDKENYKSLIDKEVYIPQFPGHEELSHSEGKIKSMTDKYEFSHLASTNCGSSGSPIFLFNSSKVLGIHKAGKNDNTENYGDFIGPIYNFLKNDIRLRKFLYSTNIYDDINVSSNRDGYGKSAYNNGDYYIGNLREGIPNGRGVLYDKRNNKKFEGSFINGQAVNGTYFFESGEFYKGPLSNNSQNGFGKLFYSNGDIKYEGNFVKGIKEGKGKYFYENGEYYEGDFHNNLFHGKGKIFYANDNIHYEGDFFEDEKNGKGILYNKKGKKVYEGDFKQNKFEGKGKYIYDNGNYYIGPFKNNKRSGYGEYYSKEGDIIYEGDFARDVIEGEGKYVYEDGSYYVGKFKNGKKHGMGTMYLPNGNINYEGRFENDEFINEDNE